ncbi:MAG: hypothetical protein M3Z37_11450 [Candidatus Eremiobacteraeota bacterium]|nr:hypothetical protein [Candidatus Eremiobacteraeota bacterium]
MDEPVASPDAGTVQEEGFGVAMPPNARIGGVLFDDTQHCLRVSLADGGDERVIPAQDLRAFYGARIRNVSTRSAPPKAQGVAMSSTALMATTHLPTTTLDPSRRGDTTIQNEELYFALALRIERSPELWYLIASSFNFRKALGNDATYSTELNLREFVRRLSKLAPDAVRDGFFTAVLQGSPLPPPLESLLEFFRLVAR